ncbi:MAG: hypothetical protein QM770_04355 [Tepidisphaeraceae bacterium]
MSSTFIDRRAVVRRHNVVLTRPDPLTPLTVGNGDFAFTVDITGLQTFPDFHETGMPIGTQSNWGWHSFPNPNGYTLDDCTVKFKDAHGRDVPYRGQLGAGYGGKDKVPERAREAMTYLRENPHRIDLGRLGLLLKKEDGSLATIEDLHDIRQELDLWSWSIASEFSLQGRRTKVTTISTLVGVVVRIQSELASENRIGVSLRFAGPCPEFRRGYDWSNEGQHVTDFKLEADTLLCKRKMDDFEYCTLLNWTAKNTFAHRFTHRHDLYWCDTGPVDLYLAFTEKPVRTGAGFEQSARFAAAEAEDFWSTGGVIDLSGSTDPRAHELERRIVLSRYLTAVNCAGTVPPQETGLTCNSWFGKMHLEMHWWHAAHFPLWGQPKLLERSLPWYRKVSGYARGFAQQQGYTGVRWQKMLGPFGPETPSDIGVMLIWQQPHFIAYCELLRRAGVKAIERDYADLLFETADFMHSFAARDEAGHYSLGPPLIPAQEVDGKFFQTIKNPPYELAYWYWGLKTANAWRERLGLSRRNDWDEVADKLAPPPMRDGHYLGHASEPFLTYADHPSHLMALGFCPPSPLIDAGVMSSTYDDVLAKWNWPTTWGWDYPVLAMTAARLGRPNDAVDALFMNVQKNTYLANGHNYQDQRLPLYLPGNGGLLYAVAMMAAGWDGAPNVSAPGFPREGWSVKHEGLLRAI